MVVSLSRAYAPGYSDITLGGDELQEFAYYLGKQTQS